jgi:hypothetical protein
MDKHWIRAGVRASCRYTASRILVVEHAAWEGAGKFLLPALLVLIGLSMGSSASLMPINVATGQLLLPEPAQQNTPVEGLISPPKVGEEGLYKYCELNRDVAILDNSKPQQFIVSILRKGDRVRFVNRASVLGEDDRAVIMVGQGQATVLMAYLSKCGVNWTKLDTPIAARDLPPAPVLLPLQAPQVGRRDRQAAVVEEPDTSAIGRRHERHSNHFTDQG